MSNALDMLLICAAPDPAALEGDTKATIQAIRMFTHHAISVFFERFRTLVGGTNGEADKEDIDKAWRHMNIFIDVPRERRYQDDEFLLTLVDGLASLFMQDQNTRRVLALLYSLLRTLDLSRLTASIRRRGEPFNFLQTYVEIL